MDERYRSQYKLLGLKIAFYRKLRGLTQEVFAEKVDLSWSFISQIEANGGKRLRGVSLNTLFRIAEVLEIPVSCLLEDSISISTYRKELIYDSSRFTKGKCQEKIAELTRKVE